MQVREWRAEKALSVKAGDNLKLYAEISPGDQKGEGALVGWETSLVLLDAGVHGTINKKSGIILRGIQVT